MSMFEKTKDQVFSECDALGESGVRIKLNRITDTYSYNERAFAEEWLRRMEATAAAAREAESRAFSIANADAAQRQASWAERSALAAERSAAAAEQAASSASEQARWASEQARWAKWAAAIAATMAIIAAREDIIQLLSLLR